MFVGKDVIAQLPVAAMPPHHLLDFPSGPVSPSKLFHKSMLAMVLVIATEKYFIL